MKVKSISFENYKAFSKKQTMKLKPITILIGRNSSGKSSIAKLFTLLENSLMGDINEPLLLKNNGVELGADFDNLFFDNKPGALPLKFEIVFENNIRIGVGLSKKSSGYGLEISQWNYERDQVKFELEWDNTSEPQCNAQEYRNQLDGKVYECEFKGFIPTKLIEKETKSDKSSSLELNKLQIDVDYIGPFRILPKRCFNLTGQIDFRDTGVTGENAYEMLCLSKLNDDNLHKSVGEWYQEYFDNWKLIVNNNNQPYFEIQLSKDMTRTTTGNKEFRKDFTINIVDVGQGMNQALPLVVRANVTDRPESIVILEQPELHLHPAAHADLVELFAKSAKKNNQTFIIETHSENILLRLRKLIVESDFSFTKDDLIIYWIQSAESGGQELLEITVDEEGVLSRWPDGVFNENIKEIIAMRRTLKAKKEEK